MPTENDPFAAPNAALNRALGAPLPKSSAKLDILFQPIEGTGIPLGGIGAGGIVRASDGRFTRWTIKAASSRRAIALACSPWPATTPNLRRAHWRSKSLARPLHRLAAQAATTTVWM